MRTHYSSARRAKHKKIKKAKTIAAVVSVLVILISITHITITSENLEVKEIVVETEADINTETIIQNAKAQVLATKRGAFFGAEHYLAWSEKLENENPEIESIAVTKDWKTKTIILTPTERKNIATWCEGSSENATSCYWVDKEGLAFEETAHTQGSFITTIYEERDEDLPIILGSPVIETAQFLYIKEIISTHKKLNIPVEYFVIKKGLDEVEVHLLEGGTIFFSLRFDPTPLALPALEKIKTERGLTGLNYLDLTVEGRAFYRKS